MTSLRMRVVEAGARVLKEDKYPPREERMDIHQLVASCVLDAMLDCLTENAGEWHDRAEAIWQHASLDDGDNWWEARFLLAALKEGDE